VWSLRAAHGQGRQLALLAPGWLHGCIGIHFAFRQRPLYRRLHRLLFAAALLLPVLGGLGFLAMGKELAADPALRAHLDAGIAMPAASSTRLTTVREALLGAYLSVIAAVFAARAIRARVEHRFRPLIDIAYPQRTLRVPRGWSVLEASRSNQLPHLGLCGGRGRCSTCRVRVSCGQAHCPPPAPTEQATLARIRAGDGIRLACQLRPRGDIAVVPLLRPPGREPAPPDLLATIERDIVLVCVDWCNRHAAIRALLPHDVVFLSGLFSDAVATAVRAAGGIECDPGADGTVAAFGVDCDLASACRRALSAAHDVDRALADLASRCEAEFGVLTDFAICVHAGSAAVGEIGTEATRRFTAAGSAVDASRHLRRIASRAETRILVSTDVLERAGVRPAEMRGLRIIEMAGSPSRVMALESLEPIRTLFKA